MKAIFLLLLSVFMTLPRARAQDLEAIIPLIIAADSTGETRSAPAWDDLARMLDTWSEPDRAVAIRLAEIADPPPAPARKATAVQKVRTTLAVSSAILPLVGSGLLLAGRRDEAAAFALGASSLAGVMGILSIRQQVRAAVPTGTRAEAPPDLSAFRMEFRLAAALLRTTADLPPDRAGVAERIRNLRAFHEVGLARATAALLAAPADFAPDRRTLEADIEAGEARWSIARPLLDRVEQAIHEYRTP